MGYKVEAVNDITNANDVGLGVSFANQGQLFSPIYTTKEQSAENLKTLLLTQLGERYLQPNFGTDLLRIIFEPNITELKPQVIDIITNSVIYWLPNLTIENIEVTTLDDDPTLNNDIRIHITYSVENINNTITIGATGNNITVQGG